MRSLHRASQAGATLVVSLIMLTLITLMILAALAIGLGNFRTVSNMQFRDEALAAANRALDQVMSTPFTVPPVDAEEVFVDLDSDGNFDYRVNIATPQCIKAVLDANTPPSSLTLPPEMAAASNWITTWELRATVQGISTLGGVVFNTGDASVDVRTGVRVLMSGFQKDTVCT